ncbi:TatD family hydrolase [Patescibacteria group bacterium]|nr:TatD family hydrolase [Patescibacteria group bacterium]
MTWQYIDTHAHVNLSAFNGDREVVLARAYEAGVAHINIGTKRSTSARAVEIAEAHDDGSNTIWAIVGLHPIQTTPGSHGEEEIGEGGVPFVSRGEVFDVEYYRALARHKKVVGIGECGFDYYHCDASTYEAQEDAFIAQIRLANELKLPLMIHTRDPKPGEPTPTGNSAYDDVLRLLREHAVVPGNVHFYAGSDEQAKQFFDIGFTISFTGVITFARAYEELVKAVPLDRMHAETDCPYVAPVPYRGQRCEPAHVIEVVKKIADLKNLDIRVVSEQLAENARSLYGL